jgi:hypothetical protein
MCGSCCCRKLITANSSGSVQWNQYGDADEAWSTEFGMTARARIRAGMSARCTSCFRGIAVTVCLRSRAFPARDRSDLRPVVVRLPMRDRSDLDSRSAGRLPDVGRVAVARLTVNRVFAAVAL